MENKTNILTKNDYFPVTLFVKCIRHIIQKKNKKWERMNFLFPFSRFLDALCRTGELYFGVQQNCTLNYLALINANLSIKL